MRPLRRFGALVLATMAAGALAPAAAQAVEPQPVYAYYYIWFQASSWNRAKSDYPMLGRYTSDERIVMRKHIRMAKQAGIDGFIVSWKSTGVLNDRLHKLIQVAKAERFKLAIIYQGLDFERHPLPAERVGADLTSFRKGIGRDPVFRFRGKPLVIWSGTWKFSTAEIRKVGRTLRPDLALLATERNPKDYERLAKDVDGNAYYWSSVNPDTYPRYHEKLQAMGELVHANNGLWIAPVAPGFDARMIGGKTVVERKGGETLRRQFDAAYASSPDMVGLISWNEFSENSHVEPSERFRDESLQTVADVLGAPGPNVKAFDSSDPGTTGKNNLPLLSGTIGLLGLGVLVAARRRRRREPGSTGPAFR